MTEFFTQSRIPIKPLYTPEDTKDLDYNKNINDPGAYPYTRGRHEDLYQKRVWLQRELSGEGGPSRSNQQLKDLIKKGQMAIDVIGDTPSMACLDPDHPYSMNAVGSQGVSICCLKDFRELLKDLPIALLPVSFSLPPSFGISCFYLVARENGVDPDKLRGSAIQAPFYTEDCGYSVHLPFRARLRMAIDSIEFCSLEMKRFHSFLEDTYFFSEAGLDSVEEMALGFIEIRYIVRELIKRGVDVDSFAPRIALLVNCRMDFFEEIAKIRASRRLFARMMKEEFGAQDRRSWAVVVSSHTSGLSLTAQQPVNNVVRGAVQTVALALAGVQALELSAFDEAYRIPSPESHLVGLRTQQVVHLESNVANVVDPLGGSYFVESLTDEMEKRILDMVRKIEAMGDCGELVEKGYFRSLFTNAMERYSRQISETALFKVGLNVHQIPDEEDVLLKEVSEGKIEPCWDRIKEIGDYKKQRDMGAVEKALREFYQAFGSEEENLMYPMIEAFQAGATNQEITGIFRMAYGHPYDPFKKVLPPIPL